MSRAYTEQELKDKILHHIAQLVDAWADEPREKDVKEKMYGLVHSTLAFFGGRTLGGCSLNLVADPHPDDKDYHISNKENYFEPGTKVELDSADWFQFLYEHGYKKKNSNKKER